jgi:hypothetical protein
MAGMGNGDSRRQGLFWAMGAACLWLRDRWVLGGLLCLGGLAVVLPYFEFAQDARGGALEWSNAVRIVGVIVAALAAFADRIGDIHSRRVARRSAAGAQNASAKAMSALLTQLQSSIDTALSGALNQLALTHLRTLLVTAAQRMPVAEGVRATFYPLRRDEHGRRVLDEPTSHGRDEEATTTWFEAKAPEHPIWKLMDAADINAAIFRAPLRDGAAEDGSGVDWSSKAYQCFISVPVTNGRQQFGMLSINAPDRDDLTEADRVALVAAARVMSLVLTAVPNADDTAKPVPSVGGAA